MSMPDRLSRWIGGVGFFCIVFTLAFDHVLAYVASSRGQEADWSSVIVKDPLWLNSFRTGEGTGLADKRMHQRRWKLDGRFVYHERLLPTPEVCFNSDTWLRSLNDAITATRKAFGDGRPGPSPGVFAVSIMTATGDDQGD